MIGIKCAACGKTFDVEDKESGKNAKCPDCGAIVFVPTVGSARMELASEKTSSGESEKAKHFLSPLEVILILVILGIMIAFVVYRGVIQKPEQLKPADNAEQVQQKIQEEHLQKLCEAKLKKISGALLEYREKRKMFPPDLVALKEEGLFEAGIPLSCEGSGEDYAYFMREAVASEGVVEDPIIVSDSSSAHGEGRLILRISGKVEYIDEKLFVETIAAQKAEFGKLDAAKAKATREKERIEMEAAELMIAAATAYQSGQAEEALRIYKKLVDEYGDTETVTNSKDQIISRSKAIVFSQEIEDVRELVRQLRLDDAKTAYEDLSKDASEEHKKTIDSELEAIKLIENGRSLRTLGDLSGAFDQYKKLGSGSPDPFWKKIAHGLSEEVENYRNEASKLFKMAENALNEGKKTRAFILFQSVVDNYQHSAEAPKAKPAAMKLINEIPYKERFLPKDKLIKSNVATVIRDGLGWLAVNQSADGSWKNTSKGEKALDEIGLTGLAMLCFLAEGNTHLTGTYRGNIAAALSRLKKEQAGNGLIGNPASPTYRLSHALAFLAINELRNMTEDEQLTPACEKALEYAIGIQEPGTGWRLADKEHPSDIMLTTWMQLGMLSAKTGKIKFLEGLLDGALNTYNAASDSQGRINYNIDSDKSRPQRNLPGYQSSLTATASGAYGKLMSGSGADSLRMKGALEFVRENLPNLNRTNFPFFFFGTAALYQVDERLYLEWYWALNSVLLKSQLSEGTDAGAWDMGQFTDFRGGKVYPTALVILSLQVPYNHFADINLREKIEKVQPKGPIVTVVLKDGVQLTGRLLSETEEMVVIEIVKGTTSGEMPFRKKDVKEIIRK